MDKDIQVNRPGPQVQEQISDDLLQALRGRAMARNTVWNVIGQVLPLCLAAVTIPILIRKLGVDRFGVLALAWTIVGSFGLFDLGLGRAITKVASEALAAGKQKDAATAVWTACSILALVGTFFTVILLLASHSMVFKILKVPPMLRAETLSAIDWLAVSIPVITVTAGLRGLLEAQHRFGLVNVVRVVMGIFSYAGPLVTALISTNLAVLCAVLVAGRILAFGAHLVLCAVTLPPMRERFSFDRQAVSLLVDVGAWITVSNTIGPIVTYGERFMIGFLLSVSAVAYYATPSELVLRLLIVPAAITTVLFPAFAALATFDRRKLQLTYDRGIRFCFLLIFPVTFLIVLFAPEGLNLWLGPVFAEKSTLVLRWVTLGIFVNSIAQVPFALMQAANRPDLPGKLLLVYTPLYLVSLVAGIRVYGIAGAAAVWALRLIIEGVLLLFMADRALVRGSGRLPTVLLGAAAIVTFTSIAIHAVWVKVFWSLLVVILGTVMSWRLLLRPEERDLLTSIYTRQA